MANFCKNNIVLFCTDSELKEITEGLEKGIINWAPTLEDVQISEYEHEISCCTKWSPTPWEEGYMDSLSQKYPCTIFRYKANVEGENEEYGTWFANGETGTKTTAKNSCKKMINQESKRFIQNTQNSSNGLKHKVAIMPNGSVAFDGENVFGECNVLDWENIQQISTGNWHTVGLKNDGKLIACGSNANGQCDVQDIGNAIQISCGRYHTAILLSDGTICVKGNIEEKFEDSVVGNTWQCKSFSYPILREIQGTAYENRNDHIEPMVIGEQLKLVVDRKNKFYKPVAIEVFNDKDETVGYLDDDYSIPLSVIATNVKNLTATVESVTHVSKRRKGSKYSLMTVKLEEKAKKESKFTKVSYDKWKNIVKICSLYDAVLGLTKDGEIIYDGYYGEVDETEIENIFYKNEKILKNNIENKTTKAILKKGEKQVKESIDQVVLENIAVKNEIMQTETEEEILENEKMSELSKQLQEGAKQLEEATKKLQAFTSYIEEKIEDGNSDIDVIERDNISKFVESELEKIKSGNIDVNQMTNGHTYMINCILNDKYNDYEKYLIIEESIKNGADINKQEAATGATALYYATQENKLHIARLLIKNEAIVDAKDNQVFQTPLHIAIGLGNEELVKLLIRHGANIDDMSSNNTTPFMKAVLMYISKKQEKHKNIIKILADNGADFEQIIPSIGISVKQLLLQTNNQNLLKEMGIV